MTATTLFRRTFGGEPAALFSAPGRVNLIGEHTDYNNGLVLPFAIDARAELAVARTPGTKVRIVSAQRPELIEIDSTTIDPVANRRDGWVAYVIGVLWALADAGLPVAGFDLALDSAVPSGAGLSSSAAVECVTALAVSQLLGVELGPERLARLAQRAENDYVGVPCGLMDQMASSAGRAGHLLFFDVGRDVIQNIPFDPVTAGFRVLVIDTRVHHALADGEYAKRRASCETAAAQLGLASLREIDPGQLEPTLARLADGLLRRRVRHIVTENARVEQVVALLGQGRIADVGPVLTASHVSMRDDYEISSVELDVAVQAALDHGALGARMTGGGFGGSTIALVAEVDVERLAGAVEKSFAAHGFAAPQIRTVTPAAGARREG